ncbi:hypothetical protein J2S30_005367 [Herbaspirillum rubrisubalbicans]|uniref:hypothetical protein n=1 Tax=Herbaspirillum rubrisubalbicans TaxID=80842 RepID=UPI00209ED5CB|nr:hypothetical protein [Herbaspirillum rubrisubalbicans]MCP1576988.1 hypothetical protein [Herbaspirillum rubrisubalbicans]
MNIVGVNSFRIPLLREVCDVAANISRQWRDTFAQFLVFMESVKSLDIDAQWPMQRRKRDLNGIRAQIGEAENLNDLVLAGAPGKYLTNLLDMAGKQE